MIKQSKVGLLTRLLKGGKPAKTTVGLFRGGAPVKAKTETLKNFLKHERGIAQRKGVRKDLLNKLVQSVKGGKKAPKFGKTLKDYTRTSGQHLEQYFTKSMRDVFHPKETLQNILASTKYYYNPQTKQLAQRSIMGNLMNKGVYLGLPISYGAGEYVSRRKSGQGPLRAATKGTLQTAPWMAHKRFGARWLTSMPLGRIGHKAKTERKNKLLQQQMQGMGGYHYAR